MVQDVDELRVRCLGAELRREVGLHDAGRLLSHQGASSMETLPVDSSYGLVANMCRWPSSPRLPWLRQNAS